MLSNKFASWLLVGSFLIFCPFYNLAFAGDSKLSADSALLTAESPKNSAPELPNGVLKHTKSVVIATYALCGFAEIGFRAMIAGTLACFQTAAIAGMLL